MDDTLPVDEMLIDAEIVLNKYRGGESPTAELICDLAYHVLALVKFHKAHPTCSRCHGIIKVGICAECARQEGAVFIDRLRKCRRERDDNHKGAE